MTSSNALKETPFATILPEYKGGVSLIGVSRNTGASSMVDSCARGTGKGDLASACADAHTPGRGIPLLPCKAK